MKEKRGDAFSDCHPGVNFFCFAAVILITMLNSHPLFLGISFLGALCYASRLQGWQRVLKFNLLATLPAMIIVAFINPAFNHYGVTMLFYLKTGPVTLEAIVYGLVLASMLFISILWFSCYNKVMTTDKFVYLFGRVIPALSLVLSMVFRFVPRFGQQLTVIRNGQKAIGRDVKNGNIFKKMRHGITIFSVLVTWALENAIETSDSMKCRANGEKGRTAFSLYRFDKRDILCLLFMGASFALTLFGFSKGYTFCQYNPKIIVKGIPLTAGSLLVYLAFLLFSVLPVVLELWDRYQWKQKRKQVEKAEQANYRLWEVQD